MLHPCDIFYTYWAPVLFQQQSTKVHPASRHVPGSQPTFSLILAHDQNMEKTAFISVVAYGVYISLPRPIQFSLLPNQNFEIYAQDSADAAKPCIQDPSGVLPIFVGFKSFQQKIPLNIIAWTISRNTQKYRRSSCFVRIDV